MKIDWVGVGGDGERRMGEQMGDADSSKTESVTKKKGTNRRPVTVQASPRTSGIEENNNALRVLRMSRMMHTGRF